MIAFDGGFYQIRADGKATPVDDGQRTPFAVVQFFEPDWRESLQGLTEFRQLQARLDQEVGSQNLFYALRLDGTFEQVRARSVPRQQKPYPPRTEVAKAQSVFEFEKTDGTLIGFRFPAFAEGFNVAGYHCHFITADRRAGGHVLDFRLRQGTLSVDHTASFHVE